MRLQRCVAVQCKQFAVRPGRFMTAASTALPPNADADNAVQAILLGTSTSAGDQAASLAITPSDSRLWRTLKAIGSAWEWLFGTVSIIGGLALFTTIPVLQLLSLGYLLEVSGRIARTGQLRSGFIGVRKAARVGSILLGVWLFFWPLRFATSMWTQARLIDPTGPVARQWRLILVVLSVVIVAHVVGACLRGGRLRSFLRPRPILLCRQLFRRDVYTRARDAVWNFTVSLRCLLLSARSGWLYRHSCLAILSSESAGRVVVAAVANRSGRAVRPSRWRSIDAGAAAVAAAAGGLCGSEFAGR